VRIAIVAPSPIPFVVGGAENLWWGMLRYLNESTEHQADLIKVPVDERSLISLVSAYRSFSALDLSGFDWVISTKYPAWMVNHPQHVVYLQHTCRGFYDWYPTAALGGTDYRGHSPAVKQLIHWMALQGTQRAALPEFFARFDALAATEPTEMALHPSPFGRAVIRFLDGIGLAPRAILRHLAIAETVKRRVDYFPRDSRVEVVYHPTNKEGFADEGEDYFFTASRFYPSKRLDLIIRAYRTTSLTLPLKIAGTGAEEATLRTLAAGDDRIQFVGHVTDAALVSLYNKAIAIAFVPEAEDFGYITLEAMLAGKPVITTRDSGGPAEMITHGFNGLVVEPTVKAVAHAFEHVQANRDWARHLGHVGRERARAITWPALFDVLLNPRPIRTAARPQRFRITLLNPFAIWPPSSGGAYRVYSLYRAIADHIDVDLITLGLSHEADAVRELAPGFRELTIARTAAHHAADIEWHQKMGMPVYDITALRNIGLTPAYLTVLEASLAGSQLAVISHPYMLTALQMVGYHGPFLYDAQNHEHKLKAQMLKNTPARAELLDWVETAEATSCRDAKIVLTTCDGDRESLAAAFEIPGDRILTVPNGTDVARIRYAAEGVRRRLKRRLKLPDQPIALFLASGHQPNIQSAEALFREAAKLPNVAFALVGNLADAFAERALPDNIWRIGSVSEEARNVWLETVDIALNPALVGGGTNLKLLDYFAAGIPVISSAVGVRGIGAIHREHVIIAEIDTLAHAIGEVIQGGEAISAMTRRARQLVERDYDWKVIATRLVVELQARKIIPVPNELKLTGGQQ
jgi:glycosyltransferase involved in cell wall biosynthesis